MEITISKATAMDLLRPMQDEDSETSLMDILGIQWVMCKGFGKDIQAGTGYEEYSGIDKDDYDIIECSSEFKEFQLWL